MGESEKEWDGVSMTGNVSLSHVVATLENGQLEIKWKSLQPEGKVKIMVAACQRAARAPVIV